MKNIFILICIIFTYSLNIIYGEINEYEYDIVNKFDLNTVKKESLGYSTGLVHAQPNCFALAHNNIYINDNGKYRLAIFDSNFNFIKEVKVDKYLFVGVYNMAIGPDNNVYLDVKPGKNITKLTLEGKILYEIPRVIEMSYEHFYFIGDYVFYYDDDKKIGCINDKGEIFGQEKSLELLTQQEGWQKGFFTNTPHEDKFKSFLSLNNLIYINNKLYAKDENTLLSYFNMIKSNFKEVNEKSLIDITDIMLTRFVGYDEAGNYYLAGRPKIGKDEPVYVVINKFGQILDCFYCGGLGGSIQIAPNGDIWGMSSRNAKDEGYIAFKKITAAGRWRFDTSDTPTTPDITDTPSIPTTTPKALSITATSFVDWKNTYTPAKAFDEDLKTGWLEGVKGPGTGEAISLKLDKEITIDEIAVAPGYFDPKWWKSNNRVKSLRITYSSTSRVLQFKDEMTVQNVKLTKEIRFSEIAFEITDVYLSGKDNDTAISEIEFYYKGEKVGIDMSGVR